MGFDFHKYPFVRMIRFGNALNFDPTATLPSAFGYLVGDEPEEWRHGTNVYHNPNALHPPPQSFFKGFSQHWIENGVPDNRMNDFSPIGSITLTVATTTEDGDLSKYDDMFRRGAAIRARMLDEMFQRNLKFHAWRDKFVHPQGNEPTHLATD